MEGRWLGGDSRGLNIYAGSSFRLAKQRGFKGAVGACK